MLSSPPPHHLILANPTTNRYPTRNRTPTTRYGNYITHFELVRTNSVIDGSYVEPDY